VSLAFADYCELVPPIHYFCRPRTAIAGIAHGEAAPCEVNMHDLSPIVEKMGNGIVKPYFINVKVFFSNIRQGEKSKDSAVKGRIFGAAV
jgi:hypothetical protein